MTQSPTLNKLLPLSAVLAIGLSSLQVQAQTIVRIGHVGPVSGPQAHYGRDNEKDRKSVV